MVQPPQMVNTPPRGVSAERRQEPRPHEVRNSCVLLAAVALAVISFCLALYGRRVVLSYLPIPDVLAWQWLGGDATRVAVLDRVPILCAAGWILGVSLLVGRLLFDLLRITDLFSRSERIVFSFGLGLNVLSLVTLAFGLAGQMGRWWFVGITCASVVGAGLRWRRWRHLESVSCPGETTGVPRAALGIAALFCVFIFLGGMLPPWHFDVREYHLQVPKEWYRQGYIGFLPHNVYGNMPLGAEMHALLGMVVMWGPRTWWWGSLVGKTVIAAFAPLAAWAVYLCGRRFLDQRAAAFAAVFFVSTPWVAHVSSAGMIDVASAFYCVTAVHVALRWRGLVQERPEAVGTRWGLPLLAGLLAGAGTACKYPALVFLVMPLVGWMLVVGTKGVAFRAALSCVLGVAVACGPWFAKNWVLSGNPTYPLLYKWFDGKTRTPEKDAQWNRAHNATGEALEERFSLAQLRSSASVLAWRSDYASPLLVPFLLLGLFTPRHRRTVMLLAAFCGYVLLAWWLMTHRVDRFLLPILPIAALIAGVGATRSSATVWRRGVRCLVVIGLTYSLGMDTSRLLGDNRFLVSLDALQLDLPHPRDRDYTHVHMIHHLLNEMVLPGYRALVVGEAQVFNIDVPILYNTCFDDCLFEQLMKGKTREERYQTLRERRISHVAVFWRELERYRSPGNYGYSSFVTHDLVRREMCQTQKLMHRLPLRYDPDDCEVLEVEGWRDWEGS